MPQGIGYPGLPIAPQGAAPQQSLQGGNEVMARLAQAAQDPARRTQLAAQLAQRMPGPPDFILRGFAQGGAPRPVQGQDQGQQALQGLQGLGQGLGGLISPQAQPGLPSQPQLPLGNQAAAISPVPTNQAAAITPNPVVGPAALGLIPGMFGPQFGGE